MKRLLIFTAMTCAFSNMNAQDVLITQDGELLNVYGLEISDNAVFYKTEDKKDAPIQRIGKEKILMVKCKDRNISLTITTRLWIPEVRQRLQLQHRLAQRQKPTDR